MCGMNRSFITGALAIVAFASVAMVAMSVPAAPLINDYVHAGKIHDEIERLCGEIYPDERRMPTKDPSNWEYYIVRRGDCLSEIASLVCKRSYHDVNVLMELNNLSNDRIRYGQIIKVPYFGYVDFVTTCLFGARNEGESEGLGGFVDRLDACRTNLPKWDAKLYYCRLALGICHERNVAHSFSSNVLERTKRLVKGLDSQVGGELLSRKEYLALVDECRDRIRQGKHVQKYNFVPVDSEKEFDVDLRPTGDVADYIARGDAHMTAWRCDYPLRVNGVYPVFPSLRNMGEMTMWFSLIFDEEERKSLAKIRNADLKTRGWGFHNWRGEMFGNGSLWRGYENKQLFAVNDVSKSLYDFWKRAYRRDLQTLAPQFRTDCRRAAYYFVSEDRSYFGRVDIMGELWTVDCVYGPAHCKQARIMLFKSGQRSSDVPWKVFNYDSKYDKEHPDGTSVGDFSSEEGDFEFSDNTLGCAAPDCPDMSLSFGAKTGHETFLRLEQSDVWPPRR